MSRSDHADSGRAALHAVVTQGLYTPGLMHPNDFRGRALLNVQHPSSARRLVLAALFTGVLSACGGGGGSSPAAAGPSPAPSVPPSNTRWISSAAHIDLAGGADSGLDGPLLAIDPAHPGTASALRPDTVDSTSLRIVGGTLDASLSTLDNPGPRFVVYDAPVTPGVAQSFALYRLPLDVTGTTAPVPQRLSTQVTMCSAVGARFKLIGQSLAGDEALFTFDAPDSAGSCASGGEPKLVRLSMSSSSAPLALPVDALNRITPIGVMHGSAGQIAALLAWQNGQFVLTDASLANPVALASADVAGVIGANSAPIAPGIVTRYGIFVLSTDGLRRYDKSSGKLSAVLLAGQVAQGAQINAMADAQALYITRVSAGGSLDLFRIDDAAAPSVVQINTEGTLDPWGFRLLKSAVLYAVAGRNDFNIWRKSDGARSNVLDSKVVVLSSSLYDRVFHSTTDGAGNTTLASSLYDGSDARSLGAAQLLSGALAPQAAPFARTLRGNGAFAHAVVVVPAVGQSGLAGAAVRWLSFDSAAPDLDAGTLPTTLALGTTVQAPGIVGDAGLFAVPKAGSADAYVFVSQRAAGSLARVANGVQ